MKALSLSGSVLNSDVEREMLPHSVSFVITEDFPRLPHSVSVVNPDVEELRDETEGESLAESSEVEPVVATESESLAESSVVTQTEGESLAESSEVEPVAATESKSNASTFSFICNY
jgi:hypothetical protein